MNQSHSRLIAAYERMMERVHSGLAELEQVEADALPELRRRIDEAAELSVRLGELTREEAELIGAYVRRDVEDAGHYLAETGHELKDWLRFDLELVEDRMLEWFGTAADHTRLAFLQFSDELERASHYRAGEITGPGTLRCDACGAEVALHGTSVILPCVACGGESFKRIAADATT